MLLEFFDANLFLGRPSIKSFGAVSTGTELLKKLDDIGIERALVWHIAQHDVSPTVGNRLLVQELNNQKRLYGCWTVLPPQTQEVIKPGFFDELRQNRIAGLRVFPDFHHFLLNRVVFGAFLDEVTERRIPLFLSLEKSCMTWPAIYQVLSEFPNLTCILCDIGVWGVDRYTWPLLERFPNVYVETSLLSLEDGGMEAAVKKFGPGRFVFGSGFPERYPESAVLQLTHADIPDPAKEKIASGNLQRILKEERL